jgi:hypothetical protein
VRARTRLIVGLALTSLVVCLVSLLRPTTEDGVRQVDGQARWLWPCAFCNRAQMCTMLLRGARKHSPYKAIGVLLLSPGRHAFVVCRLGICVGEVPIRRGM